MEIVERKNLSNKTIFIDGFWGSGKSLLFSLINDQKILTRFIIDQSIEDFFALNNIGKIDDQTLKFLVNNRRDILLFYHQIGRHTNMRLSDDTGPNDLLELINNLRRSFKSYKTIEIEKKIKAQKKSLPIMIHCCINSNEKMFEIWGESLRYIHICRHPLDVYKHTYKYVNDFFNSSISFELKLSINNNTTILPSFVANIISKYEKISTLKPTDISIICISEYTKQMCRYFKNNCSNRLFIDFDQLTNNTIESLNFIVKDFLGYKNHNLKSINFKKYNLPRNLLQNKIDRYAIYKEIKKNKIEKNVLKLLDESIDIYEKTF